MTSDKATKKDTKIIYGKTMLHDYVGTISIDPFNPLSKIYCIYFKI